MTFPGEPGWRANGHHIATFEHLQPVRLGGTFAAYNLKLAHLRCNLERDRNPSVEQMSQWMERVEA